LGNFYKTEDLCHSNCVLENCSHEIKCAVCANSFDKETGKIKRDYKNWKDEIKDIRLCDKFDSLKVLYIFRSIVEEIEELKKK
jgi:hypothetical protein